MSHDEPTKPRNEVPDRGDDVDDDPSQNGPAWLREFYRRQERRDLAIAQQFIEFGKSLERDLQENLRKNFENIDKSIELQRREIVNIGREVTTIAESIQLVREEQEQIIKKQDELEESVGAQLEAMTSRLDKLEERIQALEEHGAAG